MKMKSNLNQNPNQQNPTPKISTSRKYIRPRDPVLRFSPTAWAKLLFFRDRGETEIGGFGISDPEDLLYVHDFITVKQEVTITSVSFLDDAVADFFEDQVAAGRKPEQFARIWLHSHPGDSPYPSGTDQETFFRVFGRCDWAVMFILSQDGKTYARLRFNTGPGGHILIPVQVDYSRSFAASDQQAWEKEYQANIMALSTTHGWVDSPLVVEKPSRETDLRRCAFPANIVEQFEAMEPEERRAILDELACRSDLWDEKVEIFYD